MTCETLKFAIEELEKARQREEDNYRAATTDKDRNYRKGKNNALAETIAFLKKL